MSKTLTTATAVIIGAASAGTVARSIEHGTFGNAFMLSMIGLVVTGVIVTIKFAEWRFARTDAKATARPRVQL